jgi:hypothetical protein
MQRANGSEGKPDSVRHLTRRSRGLPRLVRLNPRDLQERVPPGRAQASAIPIVYLGRRLAVVGPLQRSTDLPSEAPKVDGRRIPRNPDTVGTARSWTRFFAAWVNARYERKIRNGRWLGRCRV